jgi:hypothetical protein
MISDEDELCINVVVLDEIYNFSAQNCCLKIILISKYALQDFIGLIPKEIICSIVTSECVVIIKELGWKNNQNKSCKYQKVCNFVTQLFYFK